jgi:alpha-galactosidase
LRYSRQWLDLLARSGTPLFVSADPRSLNPETETLIAGALKIAASRPPLAQPLDWMETPTPRNWDCGGEIRTYHWLPEIGCAPEGFITGDPVGRLNRA